VGSWGLGSGVSPLPRVPPPPLPSRPAHIFYNKVTKAHQTWKRTRRLTSRVSFSGSDKNVGHGQTYTSICVPPLHCISCLSVGLPLSSPSVCTWTFSSGAWISLLLLCFPILVDFFQFFYQVCGCRPPSLLRTSNNPSLSIILFQFFAVHDVCLNAGTINFGGFFRSLLNVCVNGC
jgi:hypothetical protein